MSLEELAARRVRGEFNEAILSEIKLLGKFMSDRADDILDNQGTPELGVEKGITTVQVPIPTHWRFLRSREVTRGEQVEVEMPVVVHRAVSVGSSVLAGAEVRLYHAQWADPTIGAFNTNVGPHKILFGTPGAWDVKMQPVVEFSRDGGVREGNWDPFDYGTSIHIDKSNGTPSRRDMIDFLKTTDELLGLFDGQSVDYAQLAVGAHQGGVSPPSTLHT